MSGQEVLEVDLRVSRGSFPVCLCTCMGRGVRSKLSVFFRVFRVKSLEHTTCISVMLKSKALIARVYVWYFRRQKKKNMHRGNINVLRHLVIITPNNPQ